MNLDVLKTELAAGHPSTGAYDVNDSVAADQLNAVNRFINKTSMTASEVYNAINVSEWLGLTDAKRQEVWDILHIGTINPFGLEETRFVTIFGGGSATITALAAARKTDVSRAVELGLGIIGLNHIELARRV